MAGGCRRRIAIRGPTLPGSELVLQTLPVYGGSEHHVARGRRRLGEGRELCGAADSKCLMPRRPGNREPGGVSSRAEAGTELRASAEARESASAGGGCSELRGVHPSPPHVQRVRGAFQVSGEAIHTVQHFLTCHLCADLNVSNFSVFFYYYYYYYFF